MDNPTMSRNTVRDVPYYTQNKNKLIMSLNFSTSGTLHETVELSFEDFQKYFGNNPSRKEKIKTAVTFFRISSSCGCKAVYVAGSFVSNKKNPEDIDLLFDITEVKVEKLKKLFPEFFGLNRHNYIGKISFENGFNYD